MTVFWLVALGVAIVAAGTMAWGAWRAAPYVPTFGRDVQRILALAHLQPGQVLFDLGAGDGKIIQAAAQQYHVRAIGYEISLLPFLFGWLRVKLRPADPPATMLWRDFFTQNISQANVVICFLTPRAMAKLAPKFRQELRPGTIILSLVFALPGWTPVTIDRPTPRSVKIHVYKV